jgi:hypothetical protein
MNSSKSYSAGSEDEEVLSFGDFDASLTYSYAHYLTWLFDDRVELIRGQIFKMGPPPSPYHQQISVRIASELFVFLKNKVCQVLHSTF